MKNIFYFLLFFTSSFICLNAQDEMTKVSSDAAHYDGQQLILEGHVIVNHPLGIVQAEQALLVKDETGQCAFEFPHITLTSNVEVLLSEGGLLRCQQVEIDALQNKGFFQGAPQVYYRDEESELFAEWATVDYCEKEGKFTPTKITLGGNVQLVGTSTLKEKSTQLPHYALADHVEYFPEEELMVLQGKPTQPVLFYDREKEIQLSAQTIKATKDKLTGKESVQGFGEVCFLFKQNELEKLKERFRWEDKERR